MKGAPPWTREELHHAYFREPEALQEALRRHPGYPFFQMLKEIDASYSIFVSATEDLLESIHRFRFLEERSTLYDRHSHVIIENSITCVRRGIFAASSAAMAMVEHVRRIKGSANIKEYDDEVRSRFAESRLHRFVQGLRNYSVHRSIVIADWQVSIDYQEHTKRTTFLISKKVLLEWTEWCPLAKQLINEADRAIDIEAVFVEYSKHVADFNRWLRHRIRESGRDEYQQYLLYKNIVDGFSAYNGIKLYLSCLNREAKANPEKYLDKFLTNEQIDVVLSLPPNSRERVDKIISLFDLHDACDVSLRARLYELFGVRDT